MDVMVQKTQEWLNKTYGSDSRFKKLKITGHTGWATINALTRALQIELGIQNTADNFGPSSRQLFSKRYPNGVKQQASNDKAESNVYAIIQGSLWCKGYRAEYGDITKHFYDGTAQGIRQLKDDMGIGGDSTVTLQLMDVLLSMKQFVLLASYGGRNDIRQIQQQINRKYVTYTGIIPCDGLYGREMNTALIQILQSLEGYSPEAATGYFGNGTKSRLCKITSSNASSYGNWVWLAKVALNCLGYYCWIDNAWDESLNDSLQTFRADYALPKGSSIDVNAWMSLLTSKGNPDRSAKACDTRFEITEPLLKKLKADGYQIVGRYLTGGSFKEIREGELNRITKGGMKYFPIFQDNGREISNFTYAKGKIDGAAASKAALAKGIPSTVIYFAVDMDAYDYQIDSNILPYFKGVNETISMEYSVGIYASRNICTRICATGYTVSSFVADMSTGYSGNLGFPIPKNWNYDQFHEIPGYGGNWDLDKVAYSGKIPACATVNQANGNYFPYSLPTTFSNTELTAKTKISTVFPLIKELENAYKDYLKNGYDPLLKMPIYSPAVGALQYLAKSYFLDDALKGIGFSIVSSTTYDVVFDVYVKKNYPALANNLAHYISGDKNSLWDGGRGVIDLPHLAITTLSYYNFTLNPGSWNGWAGDLVSAYGLVRDYYKNNPGDNLQQIARAYVGGEFPKKDLPHAPNAKENPCNYTDLCSDGYAIVLSQNLKESDGNLGASFEKIFTTDRGTQFMGLLTDIDATKDVMDIKDKVKDVVKDALADLLSRLENDNSDSPQEVKDACILSFAKWLYLNLG